jgi:hypothetical protein
VSRTKSGGLVAPVALLLGCLGALLFPLGAQAATEQHLFDPVISLTGTCSTEASDEIADPWCPGPPAPSQGFQLPNIAIDSFGDMYMSSHKDQTSEGRVDVFSPKGKFITELQVPGARSLAVDSKGNLYVHQSVTGEPGISKIALFRPSGVYEPKAEEIAYETPAEAIVETEGSCWNPYIKYAGLAVDPENDHLFVSAATVEGEGCVSEWSSAEEGHELLDATIGLGVLRRDTSVAVDAEHDRIYVADMKDPENRVDGLIQVFELEAPHDHLGSLDGHATAAGKFRATEGLDTVAVDEKSGNVIVSELRSSTPVVYEMGPGLDSDEEVLNTYEYFGLEPGPYPLQIAVDNSAASPNYRTLYIPSVGTLNHTFAFRYSEEGPPKVESAGASGIGETEAVLNATINPGGGTTDYRIEYTSAASGFAGASLASTGTLPAGIASVSVSAPIDGLAPGTTYRFLVTAENNSGDDSFEGSFRTYSSSDLGGSCSNDPFRSGFSANLPDCRAYELVTPPDTNGRPARGAGATGLYFPMLQASPDGNRASFRIEGGTIPGFEGSGSFNGDNYLSKRGSDGWTTELVSAHGTDALAPTPGGVSPDQEYAFWKGETSAENLLRNPRIRYPDGHSEPVGRGSLGIDPIVEAILISQNGSHTLFSTLPDHAIRLELSAPPSGTAAIYDRTHDEATHVVSLLPGDVTPAAGEDARYRGASLDGEGVAFEIGGSNMLYLRQHNAVTYEVGAGLTYAGIVEGGGRIFYVKAGNLFAFDTTSKSAIQFSKGGHATPVNISADGSTAYFLSPDVLTGKKENPNGASAQAGQENLYVSREGQLSFVGTVEPLDAEETLEGSGVKVGLSRWVASVQPAEFSGASPAAETSRLTPDGDTLIFEARAPLTGYDTDGHKAIYRYDLSSASLTCLSCNPTGQPATGEASLQTLPRDPKVTVGLGLEVRMLNIRPDGNRAFFQSQEALVPQDVDNRQDVYEWEAQGVGSCTRPEGCVYLISFGQSERDEHLFAVSESGDDAFFLSGSLLLGRDKDPTVSVYDARVNGGFPEPLEEAPCQGEACKASLTPPPGLPAPATPDLNKNGNVGQHPCGKGKRKVRRHGKIRCVKKRHRRHHHHHASTKRGQSK